MNDSAANLAVAPNPGHCLRIPGHDEISPWVHNDPDGMARSANYANTGTFTWRSFYHSFDPSGAIAYIGPVNTLCNLVKYAGGPNTTPTPANNYLRYSPSDDPQAALGWVFEQTQHGYDDGAEIRANYHMEQYSSILEYIQAIDASIFWQTAEFYVSARVANWPGIPSTGKPWYEALGVSPTQDPSGQPRIAYFVHAAIGDAPGSAAGANDNLTLRYHQRDPNDLALSLDLGTLVPVNQPLPNFPNMPAWPGTQTYGTWDAHSGVDSITGTVRLEDLPTIRELASINGLTISTPDV